MTWQLPDEVKLDEEFCELLESYRANTVGFFLDRFDEEHTPGYRGGYFNINSITGQPFDHHCCYSWSDGRALAELAICHMGGLADRGVLTRYVEHLYAVLLERYELNGYLPHVVDEQTNLATDHPANATIEPGASSYSHVFVMNGMFQYGLIFGCAEALSLAERLLEDLTQALDSDRFLENGAPRPEGHRAQGPFMIALGAFADILETLETLHGRTSPEFEREAGRFLASGRDCIDYILANHYREGDHAFWEVSEDGEGVVGDSGAVITDPGHTIEFTGFAARFARYLGEHERERLLPTCRAIFLWAAARGFHPTRNLVYKNVNRDTGEPIADSHVSDISQVVSPRVFETYFGGQAGPVSLATFPWWVVMEVMAAGSVLHVRDASAAIDGFVIRAARGVFEHYISANISGLCYQTIGDGFFEPADIPPSLPTLDLMHSHRSLRILLRELRQG